MDTSSCRPTSLTMMPQSLTAILSVIFCTLVIIAKTNGIDSDHLPNSVNFSSGCEDGSTEALQDQAHPTVAACAGPWVGHIENSSSLCAPGWQVCGWKDESRLQQITWKEATNVSGCYAFNAAQDSGSCKACTNDLDQDDLAGIGSQCVHQSYGQRSCISGGKISVSCCVDTHFKNACMYKPGLASGVLCCKQNEVTTKAGIPPQILVHPQELTHVTVGVTFVLSCQALGVPTPTVKWMKNGEHLQVNNSRISVFPSGYLLISSSSLSDSGDYQCVVSNSVGHQSADARVLVTDHRSGCRDGTTDGLEQFENIQACKGSWKGHVKRGKNLCKKGWHVCNPKHESYLKLLTWTDVTELDGCYAYNAMHTYNRCQRCHQEDMAGIGKNCGKIRRGSSGSCLSQGQVGVYERDKGRGCNYNADYITGVMCCKRPKKKFLEQHRNRDAKCTPKCDNGGVCVGENKCECRKGYKGAWCQHPVCYGGCVPNSYCIKPDVCRCYSGYTFNGEKCTQKQKQKQPRRKCKHPCFNGGLCKHGHCKCPHPFFGKMCQHGGRAHVLIIEKTRTASNENDR